MNNSSKYRAALEQVGLFSVGLAIVAVTFVAGYYEAFNAEPGFAEWRAEDAAKFRAPGFASVVTAEPTVIVDTAIQASAARPQR